MTASGESDRHSDAHRSIGRTALFTHRFDTADVDTRTDIASDASGQDTFAHR